MGVRIVQVLALLVVLVLATLVAGCGRTETGNLRRESESVDLQGASSVRTEIRMGAGRLVMDGGAEELLEAEFTYNVEVWKPELDYQVDGGVGRLIVRQPSTPAVSWEGYRYEWDLRFNDHVPMEMSISLGAGESRLDLGSLTLNRLDIGMGAGALELDLAGGWKDDLEVHLRGGAGKATIILPDDVGVRVQVSAGLGRLIAGGLHKDGDYYVNDAYDQSEVTLYIRIEAGVGEIELQVAR